MKISVNYARLSINIVRLANALKLRRQRGTGALRDFNPAYVRFGSFSTDPASFACRSMSASPRKRTSSWARQAEGA
jgi:hypothetical protein